MRCVCCLYQIFTHSHFQVCACTAMPAGRRQEALHSFGSGAVVKKYRLKQQASVSANSKEKDVLRAYKAWCLVVHPDKGGEACDFQKVRAAHESLGSAARTTSQTSPHQTFRASAWGLASEPFSRSSGRCRGRKRVGCMGVAMWLVEMEHWQSVSMKVSHRRLRSATTTLQCS